MKIECFNNRPLSKPNLGIMSLYLGSTLPNRARPQTNYGVCIKANVTSRVVLEKKEHKPMSKTNIFQSQAVASADCQVTSISKARRVIEDYCRTSLELLDYVAEEIELISQALTYAEKKGVNDEGFIRIEDGRIKSTVKDSKPIISESKLYSTVNSNGTASYIALKKASEVAAKKAQESGLGIVSVRLAPNEHSGSLGFFAETAARQGLIVLIADLSTLKLAVAGPIAAGQAPFSLDTAAVEALLPDSTATPSSAATRLAAVLLEHAADAKAAVDELAAPSACSSLLVLAVKPQTAGQLAFLASVATTAATAEKEDEEVLQALKALRQRPDLAAARRARKTRGSLSMSTRLVHPVPSTKAIDPYGGSMPPLWQTATFMQPGAVSFGEYDYTRSGNPTRTLLEEQFAELEGAARSLAFTSGMAALAAACRCTAGVAGDHIVAGDDIYGGTSRLLSQALPKSGVEVTNVDMTDLEKVRAAILPGRTKLVLIETPTNPRMQVCDVVAITAMARAAGAISCVDNSIMAPVFQRPLDLGADICMTSGTKFVGGHGDVTLGLLSFRDEELAKKGYFIQNAEGAGLAPFDCWLALRGLKTMALRMERSAETCRVLAEYLRRHPLVSGVNYAGLPGHPGHELHMRQAGGSGGSLLSFTTGDIEVSKAVVDNTKLFKVTVSFGNVNSLISLPCYMSHASIPAHVRAARGLPDDLVRISAGIEDPEDLIDDLEKAFAPVLAARGLKAPLRNV